MALNSHISWTDHTMNFWIGCQKVSPACNNCYAETSSPVNVSRKVFNLKLWGPSTTGAVRRVHSAGMLGTLRSAHNKAAKNNSNELVFCNSLSDVFEEFQGDITDDKGNVQYMKPGFQRLEWSSEPGERKLTLDDLRMHMLVTMVTMPMFTWLVLTKRPDHIGSMLFRVLDQCEAQARKIIMAYWMSNVIIGTTVENQDYVGRIADLQSAPGARRFLSLEPLLGPITLGTYFVPPIDWVIVGGESGDEDQDVTPMKVEWVRSLRDQCKQQNIPFHMKQWGEYNADGVRVGKKQSGRLVDGVEHLEFPR